MKKLALFSVALAILLGAPQFSAVASAQLPELPPLPDPMDLPILNTSILPGLPSPGQMLQPITDAIGYNLTREDITVNVVANFADIEVDIPGMVFGYGKAAIDMDVDVSIEIRVISVETISDIIGGSFTLGENATEDATLWTSLYMPADLFRVTLTADLLEIFLEGEKDQLAGWIESSFTGAKIISMDLEFDNTRLFNIVDPLDGNPSDPPILLKGSATLRYIQYMSAIEMLLESGQVKDYGIEEIKTRIAAPPIERGFFGIFAYEFFMFLNTTPGWMINLTALLPPSFSFEYLNHEAAYGNDMQTVSLTSDARESPAPVIEAYVASITNRGLVLSYAILVVGALIAIVGLPIRWYQKKKLMKHIDKKIANGLKMKSDKKP